VQRQLCLSWGVIPALSPRFDDTDAMFAVARRWVLERGIAGSGDTIILTAGIPVNVRGTTNILKAMTLD